MPDAVVVGAGHNGLVAANLLADAGWSVTVLEAAGVPGGAVRSAELTLPGFTHDLFSAFYPLAAASPVMASLGLEEHGLTWCHAPSVLAHPLPDGRCATLSRDLEETACSLSRFAAGDGAAWREMTASFDRAGDLLLEMIGRPFPPLVPAARLLGRLGTLGSLRLARSALLPVRRLAEELFAGEGAALLLGGSAQHADLGPETAGSGLYGWLLCCLGQRFGFPVPEGGAGSLAGSLVRRLESRGGRVVCGSAVEEIVVRRGRAVAVRAASGEVLTARRAVVADVAAPILFGGLVASGHLPGELLADMARFHWDTATVKVDWALDGPVPWSAEPARSAATVHVADDFDNLSEAALEIAKGALPARPFLIVGQQSRADPTRSPPGSETLWAYTRVPHEVRGDAAGRLGVEAGPGGWLEGFVDRMTARIEALAPGFGSRVTARHVSGPADLERENASLVDGAINGGTAQLHQQLLFRPVPGLGRPETPVAGLYLASSSAHPGGGVHGAAGANAARACLLPGARLRSAVLGRGSERLWSSR